MKEDEKKVSKKASLHDYGVAIILFSRIFIDPALQSYDVHPTFEMFLYVVLLVFWYHNDIYDSIKNSRLKQALFVLAALLSIYIGVYYTDDIPEYIDYFVYISLIIGVMVIWYRSLTKNKE